MSDLDPASVKAASGRGVVADLGFEDALAAGTETVVLRCGATRRGRDNCGARVGSVWWTPEGTVLVAETMTAPMVAHRRLVQRLTPHNPPPGRSKVTERTGSARWATAGTGAVEHRCHKCGTVLGIDVAAVTSPGPSTRSVHPAG